MAGSTGLHLCAQNDHAETATALLDFGAEANPLATLSPQLVPHLPLRVNLQAGLEDFDGRTPYSIACEKGHHEVVAVLDWWLSEEPEKALPTPLGTPDLSGSMLARLRWG